MIRILLIISFTLYPILISTISIADDQQANNHKTQNLTQVNFPGDGKGHGPELRYHNHEDGTFTDLNTQFMWEQKDKNGGLNDIDNQYSWSKSGSTNPDGTLFEDFLVKMNNSCNGDITKSCEKDLDCPDNKCGHAGYRDWCIPNIKQLQSLVDYGKVNPASIVPDSEEAKISKFFWSSTDNTGESSRAWVLISKNGSVTDAAKTSTLNLSARAVRPCSQSCDSINIQNGQVSSCNDMNSCEVTCDEGYRFVGDKPICSNGTLDYLPSCIPPSCETSDSCKVFVTSQIFFYTELALLFRKATFPENVCYTLAKSANIEGIFKPFLYGTEQGVDSEFTKATVRYVRIDGTEIAHNWNGLFQCDEEGKCLLNMINLDESGNQVPFSSLVWTGILQNGLPGNNCLNWSSPAGATIGNPSVIDSRWTNDRRVSCPDFAYHIYCFEQ